MRSHARIPAPGRCCRGINLPPDEAERPKQQASPAGAINTDKALSIRAIGHFAPSLNRSYISDVTSAHRRKAQGASGRLHPLIRPSSSKTWPQLSVAGTGSSRRESPQPHRHHEIGTSANFDRLLPVAPTKRKCGEVVVPTSELPLTHNVGGTNQLRESAQLLSSR